jgi:hypothetical protein
VGIDDSSKGCCVYWPDTKSLTVERNIYFDKTAVSVVRLEGENINFEIEPTDLHTVPDPTPLPKADKPTQKAPPREHAPLIYLPFQALPSTSCPIPAQHSSRAFGQ